MTTENKKMLATLKLAVTEVLDRKRRLEQYAVVWKNNHPVIVGNNDKNISDRNNLKIS